MTPSLPHAPPPPPCKQDKVWVLPDEDPEIYLKAQAEMAEILAEPGPPLTGGVGGWVGGRGGQAQAEMAEVLAEPGPPLTGGVCGWVGWVGGAGLGRDGRGPRGARAAVHRWVGGWGVGVGVQWAERGGEGGGE